MPALKHERQLIQKDAACEEKDVYSFRALHPELRRSISLSFDL